MQPNKANRVCENVKCHNFISYVGALNRKMDHDKGYSACMQFACALLHSAVAVTNPCRKKVIIIQL